MQYYEASFAFYIVIDGYLLAIFSMLHLYQYYRYKPTVYFFYEINLLYMYRSCLGFVKYSSIIQPLWAV